MSSVEKPFWQSLLDSLWVGKVSRRVQEKKIRAGLACDMGNIIATATHPILFALGDESSGKSTVLQRILQYPLLPSGPGIITRRPLEIQLFHKEMLTSPIFTLTLPGQAAPFVTHSPVEIRTRIQQNHEDIKNTSGIDSELATLKVEANCVPNLTIIDIPGLLAVAQDGEPSNIAQIAENIAREQLTRTSAVALVVSEAQANARHSPTLALLAKVKAIPILRVITKVDRALDNEWEQETQKSSALSEYFSTMPPDAISLRNYPHDRFEEAADAERKWFAKYLSDEEKKLYGARVGIDALMHRLNEIAEGVSRPSWKQTREAQERLTLTHLQAQVAELGPLSSSKEITDTVLQELFPGKKDSIREIVARCWSEQKFNLPDPNDLWVASVELNVDGFWNAVRLAIQTKLEEIFSRPALKLSRYQEFRNEVLKWWHTRTEEARSNFLHDWNSRQTFLRQLHATTALCEEACWQRAATHCMLHNLFTRLDAPQTFVEFSNQECEEVFQRRKLLLEQITTMREILEIL